MVSISLGGLVIFILSYNVTAFYSLDVGISAALTHNF